MIDEKKFRKRMILAAILLSLFLVSTALVAGCGGPSQAEIDFYKEIEIFINETNTSIDQASQLVSAVGLDESTEVILYGAQTMDQYVNPGAAGEDRGPSPEEIQAMATQFDSLTLQLSADLSLPEAPADCAACGELATKLVDLREQAVSDMSRGKEVIMTANAVATARNAELGEVKAIPIPGAILDLSAAASPWEAAKGSYEKALAAYQAIEPSADLKANLDELIAVQQKLIEATQAEINALNALDDAMMMQTQDAALNTASEEIRYFNGLIIHAFEVAREIDDSLQSLSSDVDKLRDEIPDDLDS
ncbi:MAG: hypothetical protein C4534_00530 [Gaiellales bacterium]|nr:MAG: hypothetical protein C4534_00530 [Gaiellales bacterium]